MLSFSLIFSLFIVFCLIYLHVPLILLAFMVFFQIFPLFIAAHGVAFLVRMAFGGMLPGWNLLWAPTFEACLWPCISWLLLAPQRRAPDPDENRPL